MDFLNLDKIIYMALEEDLPYGDITTDSIFLDDIQSKAILYCKEDCVVAGLQVFKRVFDLSLDISCDLLANDGDQIKKGQQLAHLYGPTKNILKLERTALNFIQRLSGIATKTSKCVNILKNTNIKLLDTRKTTPTLRFLEKYATSVGGAINHRYNLSDGILIKDNHIKATGSVKKAIELTRLKHGFVRKIEVEVQNLEMVQEALDSNADIIMLDNMDYETMKIAIKLINKKALIECSGNITEQSLINLLNLEIDYISTGSITHSFNSIDLSLKIVD